MMQFDLRNSTNDWLASLATQVHIWRLELDQPIREIEGFWQLLSLGEQERASRFYQASDSQHFIVARGALRLLLSRYLKVNPRQLIFTTGQFGKPGLDESSNRGVKYNLTHSGDLGLIAVARHREVGIDLERIRTDIDVEPIARQYLSPQEHMKICDASPTERHQLFFHYWTLKEAFMKALGVGIAYQPDSLIDVDLTPAIFKADYPSAQSHSWRSIDLAPFPGYVGALVVESGDSEVRRFNFSECFERFDHEYDRCISGYERLQFIG
jgi:4'-phosphopantetheinyl transferase